MSANSQARVGATPTGQGDGGALTPAVPAVPAGQAGQTKPSWSSHIATGEYVTIGDDPILQLNIEGMLKDREGLLAGNSIRTQSSRLKPGWATRTRCHGRAPRIPIVSTREGRIANRHNIRIIVT